MTTSDREKIRAVLLESLPEGGPWAHWVDGVMNRIGQAGEEDPVPPLPTEPYTVIGVTWDPKQTGYAGHVLVKLPPDAYHEWSFGGDDGDGYGSAESLQREIVGFEVLAEPRAVRANEVAKAVLGRLLTKLADGRIRAVGLHEAIDETGREFGVES